MSTPAEYLAADEEPRNPYADILAEEAGRPIRATPPAQASASAAEPEPVKQGRSANPYADILYEEKVESLRRAGAVQGVASKYTPEAYAEAVKLAKEFSIPGMTVDAKTVADNPEPYRQKSKELAAQGTLADAPATREWLNNLDNAAVAQDDIENLANIERGMVKVSKLTRGVDLVRAAGQGLVQLAGGGISGSGREYGAIDRLLESPPTSIAETSPALYGYLSLIGKARRVTGQAFESAIGYDVDPEALLLRAGAPIEAFAKEIGPPVERQTLATEFLGALGQVSGQLAVGYLAPWLSIPLLLGQGADIQGDRAEVAGASQRDLDISALFGAGVTAGTEAAQLDNLIKLVPSSVKLAIFQRLARGEFGDLARALLQRLKPVALGGVSEAGQEITEGIGQNTVAQQLYEPDAAIFDLQQIQHEGTVAGMAGAAASFLLHVILPGHAHTTNPRADRELGAELTRLAELSKRADVLDRAEVTGERSAYLVQLVNAAKLTQRSPEQMEAYVAAIKEKTGLETAYVNAAAFRTLYQSDDEANAAANELTGSPNTFTYYEAAMSGAPIAVPIEKYLARLAPKLVEATVEGKRFSDFVAFDPEGLTASEAGVERDTLLEDAKKAAALEAAAGTADSSQAVYDDVLKQLTAAGIERRTAEFKATLNRQVFNALATRAGIDPLELYRRYMAKGRGVRSILFADFLAEQAKQRGGKALTQGAAPAYNDVQTYNAAVPEVSRIRVANLKVMDAGETRTVSDDVARDMDFSEPVEVSVFKDGELRIVDGHHRVAAASQRGIEFLPVKLQAINATGAKINELINDAAPASVAESTDITDSPAFKRWFGASKVVDENGKPLVVYHGSSSRFTSFDLDKRGSKTDQGYLGAGFYFGERKHAGLYANMDRDASLRAEDDQDYIGEAYVPVGRNSALFPVYLALQNPLVLTEQKDPENPRREFDREKHVRQALKLPVTATAKEVTAAAQAAGYDGVIYQNLDASGPFGYSKEYVAFNPSQIKSATGNRGTFDPGSDNILFQDDGPLWVSALTQAAQNAKIKGDKASAADWMAKLRKGEGVKEEEIEWTRLEEWLNGLRGENGKPRPATTDEVVNYLRGHQMKVVDVSKGAAAAGLPIQYDMDEISDIAYDLSSFATNYRESVEENDDNYYYTLPSTEDYTSTQTVKREMQEEGSEETEEEIDLSVEMGRIREAYNDAARATVDVTVRFPDGRTLEVLVEIDNADGFVRIPAQRHWEVEEDAFTDSEWDAAHRALGEMTAVEGDREIEEGVERDLQRIEGYIEEATSHLTDGDPDIESAVRAIGRAYSIVPSPDDGALDRLSDRLRDVESEGSGGETQHDMKTRRLAGKSEDYLELLLVLPDLAGNFKQTAHWEEENVVAHVRGDIRIDADGVRALYIDEVQSDLHQQGRDEGYVGDPSIVPAPVTELPPGWSWSVEGEYVLLLRNRKERSRRPLPPLAPLDPNQPEDQDAAVDRAALEAVALQMYNDRQQQRARAQEALRVPDAPFKDSATWASLVMKRMIRYAADNGIQRIAWSPGWIQNERWRLEKEVESIQYARNGDGTYDVRAFRKGSGEKFMDQVELTLKQVRRYIGAELTERIRQGIGDEVKDPSNSESTTWRSLSEEGLKVGGEGMIYFYDTVIPSAVNKFVKKYGAKVGSTKIDAGLDPVTKSMVAWTDNSGRIHTREFDNGAEASNFAIELRQTEQGKDATTREVAIKQPLTVQSLDITPALRDAARAGFSMFQRPTDPLLGVTEVDAETDPRGAIQFGEDGKVTINLFEKRDLSTYLHECGHLYLEILGDLAQTADAPQQIKDDFQKILKYLKVDSRAQIGKQQHEIWARSFEAYIAEGKAPSVELRPVFFRMRLWMLEVYKAIRRMGSTPGSIGAALQVSLTDEVRAVMDRMVATDEQIAEAERAQQYAPIFSTAEDAGFSPQEWAAYRETVDNAHREDVDELTGRAMAELSREKKRWWRAERDIVKQEVTAEVNASPVYAAIALLTKGKNADGSALAEGVPRIHLSRADIEARFGAGVYKLLPRGSTSTGATGISTETAAELLGFTSGADMVRALIAAPPRAKAIDQMTDARMRERHGDMMTDGSLVEQAIDSVHTEGRAKVLAAELQALNRKRREVKPFVDAAVNTREREARQAREANAASLPNRDEIKVIREAAQQAIALKKIRTISPQLYRNAERKAARLAFEMAGKGKFEEAYLAKRQQILNFELYRAATAARTQIDKQVEYMRGLSKKSAQERLAKAKGQYREQINALLARFDFTQQPRDADLKRDALTKWVDAQVAAGREVAIPQWVIDEARRTPYKELTAAELQGLTDAAKNIEHLAKTKDRLLKNRKAAEWATAKAALMARATASLKGGRATPVTSFEEGQFKKFGRFMFDLHDELLRVETITERLDGGKSGPWHDYFMEPSNNAEYAREALRYEVLEPLRQLVKTIDAKRRAELEQKITLRTLGVTFDRRTLIGIVLHMGTESNRERLLKGGFRDVKNRNTIAKFTPASLEEIKNAMTLQDMQFIQAMWDTAGSMWPKMTAFQQRMGGLVPEKLPALPIVTRHGTFPGGYWPAARDSMAPMKDARKGDLADPVGMLTGPNFTGASTSQSSLKSRTGAGGPLQLDFSVVMGQHLDQVITDLTHREFAIQAMRILQDEDLSLLLQDKIGNDNWQAMQWMVANTIQGDGGYAAVATNGMQWLRRTAMSNLAVAALGLKVTTAVGNALVAQIQALPRVRGDYILRGHGKMMMETKAANAFIEANSPMMKHRPMNMDASYSGIRAQLEGRSDIRAKTMRALMSIHVASDYVGTRGIWLGAYSQTLQAGKRAGLDAEANHEEAVRMADKIIRTTQTAGAPKDLSAFERNPAYKELTLFIGPMIIVNNRIREVSQFMRGQGVIKTWPEAFGTLISLMVISPIVWELANGRGPDDDDKDGSIWDDALPWALRKCGVYYASTIPVLRDVAAYAERLLTGKNAEARMTPIADAARLLVNAGLTVANQVSENDPDDSDDAYKIGKATVMALGPLTGMVPSSAIDITTSYMWDVWTGEYEPKGAADIRYLVMRRPKDE